MKRVLVITYYWPPSGGAGVQRWLKFSKYMRQHGWEPVIYTPENPESPATDPSLLDDVPEGLEVIRTKIWEPYSAYKKFVGRKSTDSIKSGFLSEQKNPSLPEKLSVWIRGNLFIPDARRYWIRPSVKYLLKYLNEKPVSAMISTGPPHSTHLIAAGIKEKTGLPWLADFRDPWTNIDFYGKLMLSRAADRRHRKLEQRVIRDSDRLVTVSRNWAADFRELGARDVRVVTNGYDPNDFRLQEDYSGDRFELVHFGSMNADRNPEALWQVLGRKCSEDPAFRDSLVIRLIGFNDHSVLRSIGENKLSEQVRMIPYLPHREVLRESRQAAVLLLPLNDTPNVNGIIPGKLFEYLGLERPVLCIGDEQGDSAAIIRATGAGEVVGFRDAGRLEILISRWWEEFRKGGIAFEPDRKAIRAYSREQLTGDICKLLNEITE